MDLLKYVPEGLRKPFNSSRRRFGAALVVSAGAAGLAACGGSKPVPEAAAVATAQEVNGLGNVLLTEEGKIAIKGAMYTPASLEIPGYYVPDKFPTEMAMEWNQEVGMFVSFEGSEYPEGSNQIGVAGLRIKPIPANEAEGHKRESDVRPFTDTNPDFVSITVGNNGSVAPSKITKSIFEPFQVKSSTLNDFELNPANEVYYIDADNSIMVVKGTKKDDGSEQFLLVLMDKKGANVRAFDLEKLINSAKEQNNWDLEFSIVDTEEDEDTVLFSNMLNLQMLEGPKK